MPPFEVFYAMVKPRVACQHGPDITHADVQEFGTRDRFKLFIIVEIDRTLTHAGIRWPRPTRLTFDFAEPLPPLSTRFNASERNDAVEPIEVGAFKCEGAKRELKIAGSCFLDFEQCL